MDNNTDPAVETPIENRKNQTLEFIKKNRTAMTFTAINSVLLLTIWVVGGRNVSRMERTPFDQGWNQGWDAALEEVLGAVEFAQRPIKK